jgi:hypothetical protein
VKQGQVATRLGKGTLRQGLRTARQAQGTLSQGLAAVRRQAKVASPMSHSTFSGSSSSDVAGLDDPSPAVQ